MPRKPVDPGCTGSIWCPVPGHVRRRPLGPYRQQVAHIPLTRGQHKTIEEQRHAARERESR